ncbi:DUF2254 domain-containing protein [Denitrificimonas sp. JX-1]|uniref:DUF2254 domain-containing protein n=1 Tax=Denitrificimonas halotolerans TaxID=3098930 RepID=A0ABU5GQ09_9GAMM|nr:DUF2254 domain-containing protein [Denitrificimonas sp. JX-1]MDY7219078.1 DUF2254 domain-containing protein [Denitrificimonas sp. JX-1]
MNKLIKLWGDLRSSFWFVPTLMVALSVLLASVLVEIDTRISKDWLNQWPRLFGVGSDGARDMLSTLAGSMMTVLSITFSMTLLALSLASGQYSSRVLRNFMRNNTTQLTLGIFAGIFTYCLIVLRTVRGGEGIEEFVPSVAVFTAFVMSLGGIGILIYFIHHIASSIQASNIIATVAEETNASIDRVLPRQTDEVPEHNTVANDQLAPLDEREWYEVVASKSGYIQSVDIGTLLRLAQDYKALVRMEHGVGSFVVKGAPLVSLALTDGPPKDAERSLNAAFSVGRYRVLELDPAFGIRQIVDIALKALSPGINDTSTGIICVDYLSAIMARLAGRQFPPVHHYQDDTLRVIAIAPSFESLLLEAFEQIRGSAEDNIAILLRMLNAIAAIASITKKNSHISALDDQQRRIAELVERCFESSYDRALLKQRLEKVREVLKSQGVECDYGLNV